MALERYSKLPASWTKVAVSMPTSRWVMAPGWAGTVVTDVVKVLAVLVPQALPAVTDIVPPVAPAVAVMEVEVEVPDHPAGRLHV